MDYDRMFAQIDDLREHASVDSVYGQPVEAEGRTIIPVASIRYNFGLGSREGQGQPPEGGPPKDGPQAGARHGRIGGGAQARPIAVIEITPEGANVEGVVDEQLVVLAGMAFVAWMVFWIARAFVLIFAGRD